MTKRPVRRKKSTALPQPDSAQIVSAGVWKIATLVGGILVAMYASWTAWSGFGWWVPAGIAYVDAHVEQVVKPIATKVDAQGVNILSGRIEALKTSRQIQMGDKAKWEIQSHTTKDPIAIQLIGQQQKNIDETIKAIDEQIAKLGAQLQATMK